ncbi:heme ABC exporter ATP-binding protein CcmA [uncultured Alsobacter sp.]|uniref:heme ABC exporter ATP-binding protein CcmA n=1 Tax=uncultured Alsobacter sp. TaxID=1748258 RepID=UPI0025D64342|nr:heme ABC exporter ATP-binding protein CcmA [uncultured Alsobacter sp.]
MRVVAADLACERSGRPVFRNLSFTVAGGEGLVLTGRNGAGKSSLLMMLAGQIVPAAGRLAVEDAPAEKTLPELAHYIGHRDALKPSLTPLESLGFWQAMLGHAARAPQEALERLGLGHAGDLPCAYLSAGQRRRLALARLLVSSRPVWLLDEPTAALDAASQRLFDALVDEHLAAGGLAIAATHVPLGFRTATRLAIGGTP